MARKNCGVLICETMIGNCYNPRIPIRGRRLLHHHRTVQTLAPNSMPTSGIPSSNASAISLASLLARVSASGALGLRPRLKTSVSESPRHDHVDPKRRNIREQLKKLKLELGYSSLAGWLSKRTVQLLIYFVGGRLQAVFYFTTAACPNTVTYSISIIRKIMEHFPHVKLYKVLLTVEVWRPNHVFC
ncbi:hypothetical protein ACFX13_034359 [Malus domestica]